MSNPKQVWKCPACKETFASFDSAFYCCEPEECWKCEKCCFVYRTIEKADDCQECAAEDFYSKRKEVK